MSARMTSRTSLAPRRSREHRRHRGRRLRRWQLEQSADERTDGPPQVTYNGHPLYSVLGDNTPSATNGQGVTAFGAAWFAVSPAGNAVTKRSTAGRSSGY